MKTRICIIVQILLMTLCFSSPCSADPEYPAGNPEDVAVVILHTNDVHVGYEDNIGYDGLALYKEELEELYDHVLLVDAGDSIQGAPLGALSKGKEIIKIMNRIGYDFAIPGNHEFDFGFETLDDCSEELACGYTCVNFCTTDGEPVFEPWRILEAGDLKIGFVGVVTPDTFSKSSIKDILNEIGEPMYDFMSDQTGDRLNAALQKSIDEAREAGADYVILVSHLGNNDVVTEQFSCDNVVKRLTGLDMVIDGHSHEIYNRTVTDAEGKEIPIAQAGSKMKRIGQLTIYKDGRLEETLIDTVPEPKDLPFEKAVHGKTEVNVDPAMKEFMDSIAASYADVMKREIGYVSYDLIVRSEDGSDVSRAGENSLCDLLADAYRSAGKAQAALINSGTVRDNIKAGTITYGNILNMLPYSNDVLTAKVSGQMILDALEFGVRTYPVISARFPQVSGITFCINTDIDSSVKVDDNNGFLSVDGEYRVSDVMIGDRPLDPEAEYTLALSNFVLTGGDGYTMFKKAELLESTMHTDNEVLIQFIEEKLNRVIPDQYREPQGRIRIISADEEEEDNAAAVEEDLAEAA